MTPPAPNGDSPYWEEREHVDKLVRGIDLAINNSLNDPGREITATEREKLVYFGIQEFDLPITYSWYLAGANTAISGDPSDSAPNLRPQGQQEFTDLGEHTEVQEYRDYYSSEEFFPGYRLRDIWYTNRSEFLTDFYEHCAPVEYQDIYITSTRIRQELQDLQDIIEQDASNMSLSDFGAGGSNTLLSTTKEEEIRHLVSDLHLDLGAHDDLADLIPAVTKATDVIEHTLASLTELTDTTQEQYRVVDDLEDFFFYDVWRYPSLYISTQTASGPNADHLVGSHAMEFEDYNEDLATQIAAMMERCDRVDLLPELGAHSQTIDSDEATFLQMMTESFVRDTNE